MYVFKAMDDNTYFYEALELLSFHIGFVTYNPLKHENEVFISVGKHSNVRGSK